MEFSSNKNYRVKSGMKLYEQVLTHIREMILQGICKKGEYLPSEKELMDLMGVSRITVREALRLLNESGIIETQRGKGSMICIDAEELQSRSVDGNDYRTSFLLATDARLLLEPSIAALLAKTKTDEMIAEISCCFEDGIAPSAFHAALIAATNNPVIKQWFSDTVELETNPQMTRILPPAKQKRTAAELETQHKEIFKAICDGREEDAYLRMKEHLTYVRGIYESYFNLYFD